MGMKLKHGYQSLDLDALYLLLWRVNMRFNYFNSYLLIDMDLKTLDGFLSVCESGYIAWIDLIFFFKANIEYEK